LNTNNIYGMYHIGYQTDTGPGIEHIVSSLQ